MGVAASTRTPVGEATSPIMSAWEGHVECSTVTTPATATRAGRRMEGSGVRRRRQRRTSGRRARPRPPFARGPVHRLDRDALDHPGRAVPAPVEARHAARVRVRRDVLRQGRLVAVALRLRARLHRQRRRGRQQAHPGRTDHRAVEARRVDGRAPRGRQVADRPGREDVRHHPARLADRPGDRRDAADPGDDPVRAPPHRLDPARLRRRACWSASTACEFVLSRLALLDIFVAFFVLCAVHCLVLDRDWYRAKMARLVARPDHRRRGAGVRSRRSSSGRGSSSRASAGAWPAAASGRPSTRSRRSRSWSLPGVPAPVVRSASASPASEGARRRRSVGVRPPRPGRRSSSTSPPGPVG